VNSFKKSPLSTSAKEAIPIREIVRMNMESRIRDLGFSNNSDFINFAEKRSAGERRVPLTTVSDFLKSPSKVSVPSFLSVIHKINSDSAPDYHIKIEELFRFPPDTLPLEFSWINHCFRKYLEVLDLRYCDWSVDIIENSVDSPQLEPWLSGSFIESPEYRRFLDGSFEAFSDAEQEIVGRILYYQALIRETPNGHDQLHALVEEIDWSAGRITARTGYYRLIQALRNPRNIRGKDVYDTISSSSGPNNAIAIIRNRHGVIQPADAGDCTRIFVRDLHAGGLLVSRKSACLLMQKRSEHVAQLPNAWHYVGGNFEPGPSPNGDIDLQDTAKREIREEIQRKITRSDGTNHLEGLRVYSPPHIPIIAINENHLDNVQITYLGMRIDDDHDDIFNLRGNWEGAARALYFSEIERIFEGKRNILSHSNVIFDRKWVPSGLCQILVWLLLGGHGAHPDFQVRALSLFCRFFGLSSAASKGEIDVANLPDLSSKEFSSQFE